MADSDLQNQTTQPLPVRMTQHADRNSRDVAAHRARQAAAGRMPVTTYMPVDLVQMIDRMKEERGVSSRAPLIEEAVRFYIENTRA